MKDESKTWIPFKFNPKWLENENFKSLVRQNWRAYDPSNGNSTMFQFVESIKKILKGDSRLG